MTTHAAPERPRLGKPAPTPARRFGNWGTVNIGRGERAGRVLVGLAAVAAGIVLLASADAALAAMLEAALIVAGLDLVVTGATGHCPLYERLGHVPKSLRGDP